MSDRELLDKIDTWAFDERSADFTEAASSDYREGFRDACNLVRGLIQAEREPAPWVGGRCWVRGHKHEDCPGNSFGRPCICLCHTPTQVTEGGTQ